MSHPQPIASINRHHTVSNEEFEPSARQQTYDALVRAIEDSKRQLRADVRALEQFMARISQEDVTHG